MDNAAPGQAPPKAPSPRRRRGGRAVRYRLQVADADAHVFRITCTVHQPDPAGETVALPAWTPGSYLIRDFARHIVALTASADGRPLPVAKTHLDTWRAAPPRGTRELVFTYELYAFDLSVRGAYLDRRRGFINGAAAWLRVLGRESVACDLDIERPTASDWQVATTLPVVRTPRDGFGHYRAADYAALLDHPIELGPLTRCAFDVDGTPHELVVSGGASSDLDRLTRDLTAICRAQHAVFGGPRPFDRYLFLLTVVDDGYGGLEHRDSTALIAKRDDLPRHGLGAPDAGYQSLLGLASHEYFHAWHVKRLHPADFDDLDLQAAQPTELLWLFEGFTAYYDDLGVCRAGCIAPADYLKALAATIERVLNTPGRSRQSVAAASYDAWIRLYRPDENTANSTVSYYAKGALVALALDLTLRDDSDGRIGLDDVMRALWQRFGDRTAGLTEAEVLATVDAVAAKPRSALLRRWVHGTDDLPLARLFARVGVRLDLRRELGSALGATLDAKGTDARLARVRPDGAARQAGLAAGDTLIALDGLRCDRERLSAQLQRRQPGETVRLHAFRRDELFEATLTLEAPPPQVTLTADRRRGRPRELRRGWLGSV